MNRFGRAWFLICLLLLLGGCSGSEPVTPALRRVGEIGLSPVARGLTRPTFVTQAGDGTGRLFLLEQTGRIRIVKRGNLLPTRGGAFSAPPKIGVGSETDSLPFLDLSARVNANGMEQGLLGLAFYPDYAQSGRFVVDYTGPAGQVVIARFRVSRDNPDRADPQSEELLLQIPKPYANHNGGTVTFGPDGYLYISVGDGGGAGDPQNNAQNRGSLLGKILRLDVAGDGPYRIPPDNPFVGRDGRPEIWDYGLRNPWRISFDRVTHDLYIADAGQETWEEVNVEPAGSRGGKNYGWKVFEGKARYSPGEAPGAVFPVLVYGHDQGCVIVGGYVYRGRDLPDLDGAYLYGDFCSGRIWGLKQRGQTWQSKELLKTELQITSFGQDDAGEVYVVDHRGAVYRLTPK